MRKVTQLTVLILVVMEDGLRDGLTKANVKSGSKS